MGSTIDLDTGAAGWIGADGPADLCSPVAGLAGLDGRQLADRPVEIEGTRRQLEAATLILLDEAERSGAFREDGVATRHHLLLAWLWASSRRADRPSRRLPVTDPPTKPRPTRSTGSTTGSRTSHRYRIRRDERGIIHVHRPDGTEVRPR